MSNSRIRIAYLKKYGIGIDQFGIEICYKRKLNPQINLIFVFRIISSIIHDYPTWNINYLEYLTHG